MRCQPGPDHSCRSRELAPLRTVVLHSCFSHERASRLCPKQISIANGIPTPAQTELPPPYYDYPYGSPTTERRTLKVDEAVALALANASAYQQSLLDERSAREDVRQARAAFLPQFGLPLNYIGTTPSRVHDPGTPLTFGFVSASAINETSALLNATGPIDLSGRLRASLRRSHPARSRV